MIDLKKKIISSYFKKKRPWHEYFQTLRFSAIKTFKKKVFTTIDDPLLNRDYMFSQKTSIEWKDIQPHLLLYPTDSYRLVFVNGVYSARFSQPRDKNICVFSHGLSPEKYVYIIAFYAKLSSSQDGFNAMNTALAQDVAYIHIPDGLRVEHPIQIVYFSSGGDSHYTLLFPRNLVILGKGSYAEIIEKHYTLGSYIPLSNSVTEIYTDTHSHLEYFKIQNDISKSSLIDQTFIYQKFKSKCSISTFSFGGKLVRNNLHIYQRDSKGCSKLNGISILHGEILVDHQTVIEHAYPNGKSHEIYKGIFDDKAKGVFNGKIIVRKEAKKTDAFQRNNNILLSRKTSVKTKPHLEIFADDVRCSHGCTIGQFNEQALFYFRSRGISEKEARAQLMFAFVQEVLEHIPIPKLKKHLYEIISKKMNVYLNFYL